MVCTMDWMTSHTFDKSRFYVNKRISTTFCNLKTIQNSSETSILPKIMYIQPRTKRKCLVIALSEILIKCKNKFLKLHRNANKLHWNCKISLFWKKKWKLSEINVFIIPDPLNRTRSLNKRIQWSLFVATPETAHISGVTV